MIAEMVTRIYRGRRRLYLTEWRKFRGLTLEQLAGRLDVDRATVQRWEKSKRRPNPEKLAALAEALDVDPEALWSPPTSLPSLDAMIKNAPADLQEMAADIVRRLVAGGKR